MTRDESIDQFRQAFEILHSGVSGFREFRLIDPKRVRPPVIKYFSVDIHPEVIYDWIHGYFGVYNCYVGRAVRRSDRSAGGGSGEASKGDGVDFTTSISFDADAGRKPATDAGLEATLVRARALQARLSCGTLVLTGNGYQVWCPLDNPVDIRGRREWWANACKAFEDKIVTESGGWSGDGWKVDPQYDIPRIVRLLGCPSVTAEGRYARIVGEVGGSLDPERIIERSVGSAVQQVSIGIGNVPPRFWGLLGRDMRLMESWSGSRADIKDTSGSGQDCALVARLRALRFDPEEALAILRAKPNKARSTDQYTELTVRKVYGL